jgi:hypothetical protein
MDIKTVERAIKDCGLPGRLVEMDGRLIKVDILNESSEKIERRELGMSEFCDLLLEWRARRDRPARAAKSLTKTAA